MARLISCSVCMRVHSKDHICDAKKKRRLEKNKGRVDSDIYGGNKWRVTRWQVLEDCNHICLYTLYKEGKIVKELITAKTSSEEILQYSIAE